MKKDPTFGGVLPRILPALLQLPHGPTKARVYFVKRFPWYFRGMMIPYLGIFINIKHADDAHLIIHENIHWQQFQRMGCALFLFRYLFQLIFIGYDTMPLEMEARQHLPEQIRYHYRIAFMTKQSEQPVMTATKTESK